MNPRYIVSFELSALDWESSYRASRHGLHPMRRVLFTLTNVMLLLLLLLLLLMSIAVEELVFLLLALPIVGYFILLLRRPRSYAARMLKLQKEHPEHFQDIVLTDQEIRNDKGQIEHWYSYPWVTRILYCRHVYLLVHKGIQYFPLPEHCFTEGDPASFRAFIEKKTGLKVKEIK